MLQRYYHHYLLGFIDSPVSDLLDKKEGTRGVPLSAIDIIKNKLLGKLEKLNSSSMFQYNHLHLYKLQA